MADELDEIAGELEAIAGELYAMRPDGFAAARDEQVRKARAARRQPLARELGRLRRPTQSAWLVNLLWREKRSLVEELLELGGQLSQAQAAADGSALQRLTARRRELEGGLLRDARVVGERAGVTVTPTMEREVQETLSAALAVSEVAAEIRTGRLVKSTSYAGFGTPLPFAPPAPPARPPREAEPPPEQPQPPSADAEAELREAERRVEERREEAERAVEGARSELERTAGVLAERARAAEAAERQYQALRSRVDQLRQQLDALDAQAVSAGRAATTAASGKVQAETSHAAAQQALAAAEQSLANLRR